MDGAKRTLSKRSAKIIWIETVLTKIKVHYQFFKDFVNDGGINNVEYSYPYGPDDF